MKTLLGDARLLNRLTGKFEPAHVFSGFDDANRRDFEQLWKPELTRRRADFATWDEAAEGNVQDEHWEWTENATQSLSYEKFVVECDGVTQGMMLVKRDCVPHRAVLIA